MNCNYVKKLPSVEEILRHNSISYSDRLIIKKHREEIKNILSGKDDRLIMVVGPCSAWPKKAVLAYADKLLKLSDKVKHKIKVVMRVYVQKPRTKVGWLGPAVQPDPFAPADIEAGIQYARDMMVKVVKKGLPIASEILFTHNFTSFLDLLSWGCIGARSCEDQEHRIFASAIDCAVGIKNPTHGSLNIGANSIIAAQNPHAAAFDGYEVHTHGNNYAHAVLRGGNGQQNYSLEYLEELSQVMVANEVRNPAVFVDASHDNSLINGKKDYRLQPSVVMDVLDNADSFPHLKTLLKGFMLESFLLEGSQKLDAHDANSIELNGLSVTDPCISWEQTEKLILDVADRWRLTVADPNVLARERSAYAQYENYLV